MKHTTCNQTIAKRLSNFVLMSLILMGLSNWKCSPDQNMQGDDPQSIETNQLIKDNDNAIADGPGGGIPNVGNTCYLNATLQMIKAFYPDMFDQGSDALSQAGRKLMEALDKETVVSKDIAEEFFRALTEEKLRKRNRSVFITKGKNTQEDAGDLLWALFKYYKSQFKKAYTHTRITRPISKKNADLDNPISWSTLPIDVSAANNLTATMQEYMDAWLKEKEYQVGPKERKRIGIAEGVTIKAHKVLANLANLNKGILILQLQRLNYNNSEACLNTNSIKNSFDLRIGVEHIDDEKVDKSYQLAGFIVHLGNDKGGHYVAYAKKDGQWYLYNDSRVTTLSEQEAGSAAGKAYIYFYLPAN